MHASYLWLIPAAPLAAFAVNAALALAGTRPGRRVPERLVGLVACLGPALSLALAYGDAGPSARPETTARRHLPLREVLALLRDMKGMMKI